MPIEAAAPVAGRAQGPGRVAGGVAVLLGVFVICLAVPRIAAYGLIARWSEAVPVSLESGLPLPGPMLEAARDDYARAVAWMPSDAALQEAFARLTMQLAAEQPANAPALLAEAEDAFRAELAAAPDRAFAWALFAQVRQQRGASDYIEALRLSNATGPFEAAAMLVRIDVITRVFPSMPADLQAVAKRDISRLWLERAMHWPLVHTYLKLNLEGRAIVHGVISADPVEDRAFNDLVLQSVGTPRKK